MFSFLLPLCAFSDEKHGFSFEEVFWKRVGSEMLSEIAHSYS
jgi:hypothetical protein